MKLKNISVTQIVRHVVQLAAFILFPGLFISTFSALEDIVKAVVTAFSVSALSAQLVMVVGIFPITALWGRFFCGFLCSFGRCRICWLFRSKVSSQASFPSPRLDRALLGSVKYGILAFSAVAGWISLHWQLIHPLARGGAFRHAGLRKYLACRSSRTCWLRSLIGYYDRFIIHHERFFCRYLCPLGAIFTLISGKRLFKIRCNSTCVNCGLCTKKCAMGIGVAGQKVVTSGDCIDCMQCITVCPRDSLSAIPTPAVAGTAAAIAMCGLVTVGKITVPDSPVVAAYTSEEVKSEYTDRVYIVMGVGFRGETEVQVQ